MATQLTETNCTCKLICVYTCASVETIMVYIGRNILQCIVLATFYSN
jgi:hypothetical protein